MKTSQIALSITGFIVLITLLLAGCPRYQVWTAQMEGRALLAHAQFAKEVAVAEAKAKMESAALLSQADTIRAHGIARSNEIIGQSLNNNESYLKWLWLDELSKQQNLIYIPTESNMPILEAGRLWKQEAMKAAAQEEAK